MTRTTPMLCALAASTLIAASHNASADLLVNGGFENNLNADSIYNMANADFTTSMFGATAFGEADEVDIIHTDNSNFGLPAIEGDWSIALHSSSFNGLDDAVSLELQPGARSAGQMYRVEFFAQLATEFDAGPGRLEIGISTEADSFGTAVHFLDILAPDQWINHSADFIANTGFNYLTFRTSRLGQQGAWIHLDAVSLDAIDIPSPGSITLLGGMLALNTRRKR